MDDNIVTKADYVIIGAGSAGCALAARLSENPGLKVVLLEAGGKDNNPIIHLPVGYAKTIGDPRFDWGYTAGPEPGLDGRNLYYARGKVLGGSSSINGLAWVRGTRADYDGWALQGCPGWGWDDVIPYLRKAEDFAPGGFGRGQKGAVPVDYNPLFSRSMQLLLDASASAGLPALPDYNVDAPLGLSRAQLSWKGGRRQSAAATYLKSARGRPNLSIVTDALVESLVAENGAITGVRISRGGTKTVIAANAEVILSAGAVGSPLILEQSGIGDPERLRALGIPVVGASREVGENVRDHMMLTLQYDVRGLASLNGAGRSLRAVRNALQYMLSRSGELAGTPTQVIGYARVLGEGPADIQLFGSPLTYTFEQSGGTIRAVVGRKPGMSLAFYKCRPRSTGHVHLAGPDGEVSLVAGLLTHEEDQLTAIAGLRFCQRLMAQRPIADHIVNGPSVRATDSDEVLLAHARRSGTTGFHLLGSCRMGSDASSVVDLELRARAVRRLRIVDASVMPDIVGANTHAPTLMIAERAADLILKRAG